MAECRHEVVIIRRAVRILLVTQMWPSAANPDLGSFLVPVRRELERLGHEVDVVAISERGGSRVKYPRLTGKAIAAARRQRPDVVFAHFLFPAGAAGAAAALAARAPLVVMAHGQDVANIGEIRGAETGVRWVVGRAAAVIANSRWLADRLATQIEAASPKLEVIDCGVDLDAFAPADRAAARAELGWDGDGPAFLCVGSLIERKNVVRLADAFERLGRGRLAFVGDGAPAPAARGPRRRAARRPRRAGRGPRLGRRLRRALPAVADRALRPGDARGDGDGAQRARDHGRRPARVRPRRGRRARRPLRRRGAGRGLERAAELPSPNPAARAAAAEHDVRKQAARMAEVLERAVRP